MVGPEKVIFRSTQNDTNVYCYWAISLLTSSHMEFGEDGSMPCDRHCS
jgi:hypothetical protein